MDAENLTISSDGKQIVILQAVLEDHGNPVGGSILCRDLNGKNRISINAASNQFGGSGVNLLDAGLLLFDFKGRLCAVLNAGDSTQNEDCGSLSLLAPNNPGKGDGPINYVIQLDATKGIKIRNTSGKDITTLDLDGNLYLGGNGTDGDLILRDTTGKTRIALDAHAGKMSILDPNANEKVTFTPYQLVMRHINGKEAIAMGSALNQAILVINDVNGNAAITLGGIDGDIKFANADCAEEFDIAETEEIEAGTVMVLNQEGKLQKSTRPYDKKVVGIISGLGGYKPGIILDKKISNNKRLPLALMGKAFCMVDADNAPIETGDLLTTSFTPGYAMKAEDPFKAFGAVIGKALAPMNKGKGALPVLVTLQ